MAPKKAYAGCSATSAEKNRFTISGRPPGVSRRDKADNVRPRKAPVTPLDAPCLVIQGPGDPLGHVLAVPRRGEVLDQHPTPRFLEFACRRILRRRGVAAERMLLPPHSMRGLTWARGTRHVAMRAALPHRVPAYFLSSSRTIWSIFSRLKAWLTCSAATDLSVRYRKSAACSP